MATPNGELTAIPATWLSDAVESERKRIAKKEFLEALENDLEFRAKVHAILDRMMYP